MVESLEGGAVLVVAVDPVESVVPRTGAAFDVPGPLWGDREGYVLRVGESEGELRSLIAPHEDVHHRVRNLVSQGHRNLGASNRGRTDFVAFATFVRLHHVA